MKVIEESTARKVIITFSREEITEALSDFIYKTNLVKENFTLHYRTFNGDIIEDIRLLVTCETNYKLIENNTK